MKRHVIGLTILSLLLVPALAFGAIKIDKSQFGKKGKFEISGGLGYSSTTTAQDPGVPGSKEEDTSDNSVLTFQPSVGYFVIPGLEVGGMIDYTSKTDKPKGQGAKDNTTSTFGLGPLVAYYFKVSPVLHIYGRGYFVYDLSRSNDSDAYKDADLGGSKWAIGAGVAVPLGKRSGGVLKLGLDYVTAKDTMKPKGGDEAYQKTAGIVLASAISLYF